VVEYLCNHGADIFALDNEKNSALAHAAMFGHVNVVQILLDQIEKRNGGAEKALYLLRLQDRAGRTPLHRAAQFEYVEVKRIISFHENLLVADYPPFFFCEKRSSSWC